MPLTAGDSLPADAGSANPAIAFLGEQRGRHAVVLFLLRAFT